MAFSPSSLEDDLQCPVCCEFFTDPVVLDCSHSFCRHCLDKYWKDQPRKLCPVCRHLFSGRSPPANLALRNIVEVYKREKQGAAHKGREEEREVEEEGRCAVHGERLLLYCEVDMEPICVVCQVGKKHQGHRMSPVEEAAPELRVRWGHSL